MTAFPRIKPWVAVLAALAMSVSMAGCSDADTDKDSKPGASQSETADKPALEGEEVAVDYVSVIVPEGWEQGADRATDYNDIWVEQVVEDDTTPMLWRFSVNEAWNLDADAAFNTALRDYESEIEDGAEDAGTEMIDGVLLHRVKTQDGSFEYFGQTEPDDDNNFILVRFTLSAKPDGTVDEEVGNELLKGVSFDF
jgi:hypothetical protein